MDPVQQNVTPSPSVTATVDAFSTPTSPVAPLGVKVITTIIILVSILTIISLFPAYSALTLKNPEMENVIIRGLIISGVLSLIYIVLAVNLRRMKRWALYVYSIAAAMSILASLYSLIQGKELNWIGIAVPALVLTYLWSIQSKFIGVKK